MIGRLKVTFLKPLSQNLKLKGQTKKIDNISTNYILHLASWYPNRFNPNQGIFIQNQVSAISKNHTSVLISVVEVDSNAKKHVETVTSDALSEYIVYQPLNIFRQISYFLAFWSAFKKIKKDKGLPALVHVHVMFRASLIGWFINIRYKIPYIITEHSTVFTEKSPLKRKKAIIRFNKFFSKRANKIIAVSAYLKSQLLGLGFNSIAVIPNIVDASIFYKSERKENAIKKFLHVSNLKEEHKNLKSILLALDKAHKGGGLFKMTIVGSNEINLAKLKLYQSKNFPRLDIEYFGRQSQEELAEIYRQHDVLVQFSKYETFSLVVAEALACGMFVISSDIGGPRALIKKYGNGVLVPLESEENLTKEIIKAAEHGDNENESNIDFGKEEFLSAYEETIQEVLK